MIFLAELKNTKQTKAASLDNVYVFEGADFVDMPAGKTYTSDRAGVYLSKQYLSEVYNAGTVIAKEKVK